MMDEKDDIFDPEVLIDTWWNVNLFFVSSVPLLASGFNRYMVECKYFKLLTTI